MLNVSGNSFAFVAFRLKGDQDDNQEVSLNFSFACVTSVSPTCPVAFQSIYNYNVEVKINSYQQAYIMSDYKRWIYLELDNLTMYTLT